MILLKVNISMLKRKDFLPKIWLEIFVYFALIFSVCHKYGAEFLWMMPQKLAKRGFF